MKNPKVTLPLLFSIAILGMRMPSAKRKPKWKPTFTEQELAELRELPKRERELRVRELRAKYLAEAGHDV